MAIQDEEMKYIIGEFMDTWPSFKEWCLERGMSGYEQVPYEPFEAAIKAYLEAKVREIGA